MKDAVTIKFTASKSAGEVSGLLLLPDDAKVIMLFAHGAGAPMNHPFMNKAAGLLAEENIGTLRFNFPYTEKKLKRIDPAPILMETIRSSVKAAKQHAHNLPIFAGGKSMGGRMTSLAAAANPLEEVKGLIFFGFPLHAPGKDSTDRADHLFKVNVPMIFLQGTRDKLANLDLLRPIVQKLGSNAELHVTEGADHSFHMLKGSNRSDDEVLKEICRKAGVWIDAVLENDG